MKIENNTAYWCKTEELAREFLDECDEQEVKWFSGGEICAKTYFDAYKKETCYELLKDSKLIFIERMCFVSKGYKIVEYKGKQEECIVITRHFVGGNKAITKLYNSKIEEVKKDSKDNFNIERAYKKTKDTYIKVIDKFKTCCGYASFVKKYFSKFLKYFNIGELPNNNTVYKYLGKARHQFYNLQSYLIQDIITNQVYVINECGCVFVDYQKEKSLPHLQVNKRSENNG